METFFGFERAKRDGGATCVVGIDEAGRGPLAGPVVAAVAALADQTFDPSPHSLPEDPVLPPESAGLRPGQGERKENDLWGLVRDSKKLSEKQRERAFSFVSERFVVGVGIVSAETIDRMNILEATFLAMKEALSDFRRKAEAAGLPMERLLLLVDGNQKIPNLSVAQETVVGGDATVRSIAAASIVAKVTRDRMMLAYDTEYPAYGFAGHKGYGTKAHMDALRRHGACPIHRMSFKPVFYSVPENVNRNLLSRKRGG